MKTFNGLTFPTTLSGQTGGHFSTRNSAEVWLRYVSALGEGG